MGTMIGSDELNKLGLYVSTRVGSSCISPGSTKIFAATLWAKSKAAPKATPDAIKPSPMTMPRSAPRMPAAATGPGVGGTKACVQDNPNPNATAVPAKEGHTFLFRLLFNDESKTTALSAKTGMEIKKPM